MILFLVVLSSIKLAFDTYLNFDSPNSNYEEELVNISENLDIFFTACFTLEMIMKIIAYGLVLCDNSYLRDDWCKLDCIIV